MNKPQASVIVATYNRKQGLLSLLESLNQQTFKNFEVILIDDCSVIPIVEFVDVNAYSFSIKLLSNNKNSGPAISRNRGIYESQTEKLLFTDDDCVLDKNWVQEMFLNLENLSNTTIGFAGKTLALHQDDYNRYYQERKFLNPLTVVENQSKVFDMVTANCSLLKKPVLEVKGFNEAVYVAGGEDTDLLNRLMSKGYEMRYLETAIVHHDFPLGLRSMYKMLYRYGLGAALADNNAEKISSKTKNNRLREIVERSKNLKMTFAKVFVFDLVVKLGYTLGYLQGKYFIK